MAIPAISPYEIPVCPESPRVDWQIEPERCAVLVHDMQEYFLRAYDLTSEPASAAVSGIARILEAARAVGVPVIYSAQPGEQHPLRRGLLSDLWGAGMGNGPDTQIIEALGPAADDVVVTKWRYSAFERTDLAQVLARAGRDQLIVTGVYAHMGCQVTAVDAFMRDIQPFLVSDALADFSRAEHEQALAYVAKRCGRVVSSAEVVEAVAAGAASSSAAVG